MYDKNPTLMLKKEKIPDTWETIERIRVTLMLSDRQMAEKLSLTIKEYARFKQKRTDLKVNHVFSLAEQLELGFSPIMSGQIDYRALAKHYFGQKDYLPEKYFFAAYSKRRTTLAMLNYIEQNFGWRERAYVLRHFQLNEAVFVNPERPISFHFGSDICDYLYKYKLGADGLAKMGVESLMSTDLSHVKLELSQARNLGEVFVMMAESLVPKHFEKNFIYRISGVNKQGCVISAKPNPEVMELFHDKQLGNYATALVKQGIAAAWPRILGLPPAQVLQTACIYHGDSEIRYKVNYEQAARAMNVLKRYH